MGSITKCIFFLGVLCLGFSRGNGQIANPGYDSSLAATLGADDYGMKSYILVILKTGSGKAENKTIEDSLFAGHMANINHLVEMKNLIVAGPLKKNDHTYRGIFILNTTSMEEAKQWLEMDPAIKEKLLEPELYVWYGSAALPVYLETAKKVAKFTF